MSSRPTRPEPSDPARQRDEDAQYYRQVLHELIEIGTDLARAVHRQATAQPSPEASHTPAPAPEPSPERVPERVPDLAIAFDRIARSIRRTIALARKLSDPAPPSAAEGFQQRRLAARKQIIREVEDSIQRAAEGLEAEALSAEFCERLDTLDLDDDIASLPIPDIIAAIRRDLGIAAHLPGTRPWKRRTPQDVRDLHARAAQLTMARPRAAQPTADPRAIPAPPPPARPGTGPPPS